MDAGIDWRFIGKVTVATILGVIVWSYTVAGLWPLIPVAVLGVIAGFGMLKRYFLHKQMRAELRRVLNG